MSAGRFKLVIFDCSEPIINQAHASVDRVRLLDHGTGARGTVLRHERSGNALSHRAQLEPRSASVIWQACRGDDRERLLRSLTVIAGVTEVLDWLQLPVCVASSSAPEQIRGKLQLTGLLRHFGENVFSATIVARGKPAPDLFLYAAQRLATVPERWPVIEDSAAGIDAAVAAGMTAIGFCGGSHCGLRHGARLREHGAVMVIDDMRQLATAMAELTQAPAR